ncbi:MAG: amidase family protein [Acidobacteriota bacterium]
MSPARRVVLAVGFLASAAPLVALAACRQQGGPPEDPAWRFQLQEATIADVHRAIRAGQLTCRQLVEMYLERAKAFNGTSDRLVTRDGAPVAQAFGAVRAGKPLAFPTETVPISALLPDFDQYAGPPIEFGRMEATATDPDVQQQYGMTVGTPQSGQINALSTFNLRGERSVTCKGDRDRPVSEGPLPPGSPAVCEELRRLPDALERADELDQQYGRTPDLDRLPMYCIPMSFKDPFDTMDMHTTAAADARYDIDFPARDHTLVGQLRKKGAIVYAKAVNTEYNGRAGNPGGPNRPDRVLVSTLGYQRSSWSGNPSSAYDSTRAASLGSSSGSGASVSANLVMCSLCEETSLSCRGPSNHNSVALILPHKAMVSYHGGAIGSDIYNDRTGIMCRSVRDAAYVLEALRDEAGGYYDSRDIFTTVPRSSVLSSSFAAAAAEPGTPGSLRGLRIGVIRESMLKFPGVMADEPIVDAVVAEITTMLGDHLGATLVESVDPLWPDDPAVENMKPSYNQALAELVGVFFPEILFQLNDDGLPEFPEFASTIRPTELAPGKRFGSGTMAPIDYLIALADGREPLPKNLNIRFIQGVARSNAFRFHFTQYAQRRAADWRARGFTETLVDFKTLNARSKFWGDDQRAAFRNWEAVEDIRRPFGEAQGIDERMKLRELLRRLEMKVMQENRLDVVVRLHTSLPPGKIAGATQPRPPGDVRGEIRMGPYAGLTEVLVPAGYVREVYDATFVLNRDRTRYVATNNNTVHTVPAPGMPFSLVFRADPGREDVILKVASAYQMASKRRVPPPMYPPLPGER